MKIRKKATSRLAVTTRSELLSYALKECETALSSLASLRGSLSRAEHAMDIASERSGSPDVSDVHEAISEVNRDMERLDTEERWLERTIATIRKMRAGRASPLARKSRYATAQRSVR